MEGHVGSRAPFLLRRVPGEGGFTGIVGNRSVLSCWHRDSRHSVESDARGDCSISASLGCCQNQGAQDKGYSIPCKDVQSTMLLLPKARNLAELKARELVPGILVDLDWGGREIVKFTK